jgi:hypothetical protein
MVSIQFGKKKIMPPDGKLVRILEEKASRSTKRRFGSI